MKPLILHPGVWFGLALSLPLGLVAAPAYTVVDLGALGGFRSEARGINERGQVWGEVLGGTAPYFIWSRGEATGVMKPAGVATLALYGMNEVGHFAGLMTYSTSRVPDAFSGVPAGPVILATNFSPRAINGLDVVAGVTTARVESPPGSGNRVGVRRAAFGAGRKLTVLSTIAGDVSLAESEALAINAAGTIAGWSTVSPGGAQHAILWDGTLRDLHTVAGRTHSAATAINSQGACAGYRFDFTNFREPVMWTAVRAMRLLNLPSGYSTGQALGLNDVGVVVGIAGNSAVIWSNNVMTDLQTLLPAGSGWDLDAAYGINNEGQIVGYGKPPGGGLARAFLLRPISPPPVRFTVDVVDPLPDATNGVFSGLTLAAADAVLDSLATPRVGLVADGASLLLLRLSATNHGVFRVSLRAADGATGVTGLPEEDGSLGVPGNLVASDQIELPTRETGSGPRAHVVYRAPQVFHRSGQGDEARNHRFIEVRVEFTPAGSTPVARAVRLAVTRPPVIVMHGLWSDRRDAFGGFETQYLAAETGVQIFGPSYPNAAYFRDNQDVLRDEVANARSVLRAQGFACVRADVYGHSMGGILSRIWAGSAWNKRPENWGRGDIHRLVTIDSPHRGSFLADVSDFIFPWLAQSETGREIRLAVETAMAGKGCSLTAGAARDLASTSREIVQMNQVSTDVAAHVVAGDVDVTVELGALPDPLGSFYKLLQYIPGLDYGPVPLRIPTDSDLIVGLDSQGAGLLGTPAAIVYDHVHMGAANRPVVVTHLLQAYHEPPGSGWYAPGFPTGWTPLPAPPPPAPVPTRTVLRDNTRLSPVGGAPIRPGLPVQFALAPPAGVTFESALLVAPGAAVELTNAPFQFGWTVPVAAVGSYTATYIARDAATNLWWGTAVFLVEPAAQLQYLQPETVQFRFERVGARRAVTIWGVYADGVRRDLTSAGTGTTSGSTDPVVASLDGEGVITALASGSTTLSYTNAGRVAAVEVSVAPVTDRPLLVASLEGPTLRLAWPAGPAGYQIEVSDTLAPGGIWQVPSETLVTNGTWIELRRGTAAGPLFYRLSGP